MTMGMDEKNHMTAEMKMDMLGLMSMNMTISGDYKTTDKTPVSYTHLDVYKRQLQTGSIPPGRHHGIGRGGPGRGGEQPPEEQPAQTEQPENGQKGQQNFHDCLQHNTHLRAILCGKGGVC